MYEISNVDISVPIYYQFKQDENALKNLYIYIETLYSKLAVRLFTSIMRWHKSTSSD